MCLISIDKLRDFMMKNIKNTTAPTTQKISTYRKGAAH